MFKTLGITAFIFLVCLAFSSDAEPAYKMLESSTSGIIGAILGGLTAGVSVIFSVLITLASSSGATMQLNQFTLFLKSLKKDILILVCCLLASLLLPYFRVTGIPLMTYPNHPLFPSRDTLFTALELTNIMISTAIIIEVVNVMFSLVLHFPNLMGNKNTEK
ncbi:TPA: hypothetical protein KDX83_004232 [Vibrio parahaemolyticus]|uniref:hypothetical protein n=1 Tax=Vibrio harveyi group TaxID=717610 RepID=UPI001B820A08|nr:MULTISPECIES: hypothetical protein [Vibrio harveyi group]MCX4135849.1 hypothetical protein [Vibrio parahaemolyticus]MCZ6386455.1 hypothetical protein [Vibrio parahaemolyticus]MDA0385929.1 hypothetical protein [Vibrio owensii]HBC0002007.1 hypothetical protein [Vibrio parahaemolyticus]HBC3388059.1 hypothetical protein [Vibrio parahaemolyticus]